MYAWRDSLYQQLSPAAPLSSPPPHPFQPRPQELIQFAYEEKIVLMADEVYQENIYQDERPFVSARKVCLEPQLPTTQGCKWHTGGGFWGMGSSALQAVCGGVLVC